MGGAMAPMAPPGSATGYWGWARRRGQDFSPAKRTERQNWVVFIKCMEFCGRRSTGVQRLNCGSWS